MSKESDGSLLKPVLDQMQRLGRPLTRLPDGVGGNRANRSRAKLYALPNGETVRVRTCRYHSLIVDAASTDPDARLGIEGTDWLLFATLEHERTPGRIISYLLPTERVVADVRKVHGRNLRPVLSFKPTNGSGGDFHRHYAAFRLVDISIPPCDGASTVFESPRRSLVTLEPPVTRRSLIDRIRRLLKRLRRGARRSPQAPAETAPPRFCKDCRHCEPMSNGEMDARDKLIHAACTHPQALVVDDEAYYNYLATGVAKETRRRFKYCVVMREHACGREARLFEPCDPAP